jgi:putative transposase
VPNYWRTIAKGGAYFFTVVTYRRQRILCEEIVREALRIGIRNTQSAHPFTINAWVLLPDHMHCIWTLPPKDANFSSRWAMIKRFVTKQCDPYLFSEEWMTASKRRRNESTI